MARNRSVLLLEPRPGRLLDMLADLGFEPLQATSAEEALAIRGSTPPLLTILTDSDSTDALSALRQLGAGSGESGPVILVLARRDVERLREGLELGADEVLEHPLTQQALESAIKGVLDQPRRRAERPTLPENGARLEQEIAFWRSPRMREAAAVVQQAARADVTVLITGETGTGKDVAARAIHHFSARRNAPFVKVNCAAVPRELLESELFGHERGAFTGAHQLKAGKFEQADRGTIFLDEIGDLDLALQAKLLHVLQDGAFSRVGGHSEVGVDVRVLAATNQNLDAACAAGRFREDLYYRLNVVPIAIPPLRERPDEIPALVEYFVRRYTVLYRREGFAVPPPVMDRLLAHRYPGNIRELENLIKRMIVLGDPWGVIKGLPRGAGDPREAPAPPATSAPVPVTPAAPAKDLSLKDIGRRAARAAEREAIARVLEQTGWNRVRAAKLLRISYRALLYKIKEAEL